MNEPKLNRAIRILHLEDSNSDAELVKAYLGQEDLDCVINRVQTEAEYKRALIEFTPDIILGDYALPSFSGPAALALSHEIAAGTPFIFVSGTIGEEAAVEALKQGAADYILKDNLRRISTAIHRALAENAERRRRKEAEERLKKSEASLQLAQEQARLGSWEYDLHSGVITWSQQMYNLFGWDPAAGTPTFEEFLTIVHPDDRDLLERTLAALPTQAGPQILEFRSHPWRGRASAFEASFDVVRASDGRVTSARGTILDITERKKAEELARAGERRLARQRNALISLAGSHAFTATDFEATIRQITETAAHTLEVSRVSVWRYNAGRTGLVCLDLFDSREKSHSSGIELSQSSYPSYFDALGKVQIIAAEDALVDARTKEFGPHYLNPAGIGAMLDAPIHAFGEADGVLCHEHTGGRRQWTADEKTFAVAVASLVSLALEGEARRETVDALRESEQRFREMADNIEEVFYSYDPRDRRIFFASRAFERVWGRPVEDIYRSPVVGIEGIHPDDRSAVEAASKRHISGETTILEYRVVRPDGIVTWLRDHSYPICDAAGNCLRVVGVATDITERKAAEAAVYESLERFRMFSKATNDAIWDWDLIKNSLLWWNEAFETLFGFKKGDLEETIDEWIALIHDEDRQRVLDDVHRTIESGAEHYSGEYRMRRKDGSYAFVLDRGYILRDEAGKAFRMIGGVTDLTQRKEAENRIAEQAALLNAASDAISLMALDDTILFWNRGAERMYGWTADEAKGKKSRELLRIEPAKFQEAIRELLASDQWQGDFQFTARDGRSLTAAVRWTLVRGPDGKPRSILSINTDVTQQKALEVQFLRAQRMESIGTLASGIAHDLNNVLAPVLMSVELLKTEVNEEALPLLETLETSCQRGSDLVRQVLSFARGVEGQRVLVNPIYLMKDIDSIIRKTFPKKIEFTMRASRDLWTVTGDPTQLHQVLMNLCVNARDAMPDGGRLSLTLENTMIDDVYAGMNADAKPGAYVKITVSDTGTGIPPEIQEKIFEPFFTTKEVGRGTGLGLSTTVAIVRSHGGFINLYSEPGRGAEFKVYIPANTQSHADSMDISPEVELPKGHGEGILVVDDDEAVRSIAERTLKKFGYRVMLAANGAEAVAIYARRQTEIDLVLTDMTMPVMDGPATITALRAINPRVKIIGSSGLVPKVPGLKDVMPKPYTAASLLRGVAGALAGKTPG